MTAAESAATREWVMDKLPADYDLSALVEEARRRALSDELILGQADRVGMTPEDLAAVLDVPDELFLDSCERSLTELRRRDNELYDYREGVRARVSEMAAPPEDTGESVALQPTGKGRREQAAREVAHDLVERLVENALAQDSHWQSLLRRRQEAVELLPELLLEQGMMPRLRLAINERQKEQTRTAEARRARFRTPLGRVDTRGLRQRVDTRTMVATKAADDLAALTQHPDAQYRVSVGVAGPRGSGKSTLLENAVARWTRGVRIFVPAPTTYVPREFLLYLYERVCLQVIEPNREDTSDGTDDGPPSVRPVPPARMAASSLLWLVLAPLVGIAVGVALLIAAATTPAVRRGDDPALYAIGGALVLLAGVPLVLHLLQRRSLPQTWLTSTKSSPSLLFAMDLLNWRLPGTRRLLGCVFISGAAVLVAALADRWGVTLREALGGALLLCVLLTSVLWRLGDAEAPPRESPAADEPLLMGLLGRARRQVLVLAVAAGQLVLAAAGVALLLPPAWVTLDVRLVVGAVVTAASSTALINGVRLRGGLLREARTVDGPPLDAIGQRAKFARDRIRYQRTMQSGWTSSVKVNAPSWLPFGVDAGTSGQTTEAETPMTIPEIVEGIKSLLPSRGPAIVAIDELDKVESVDKARDFLNEIKGVLEARSTRFLVSMSEDAIASFERRGLPFRDVFDSAFDEVIPVPYLSPREATLMLDRRVTDVPAPFVALAYCQAGGLPRDLLRAMSRMIPSERSATAAGGGTGGGGNGGGPGGPGGPAAVPLADVAREMVHRDLAGKTEAVIAAIRSLKVEPAVSSTLRALHWLDDCTPTGPRRVPCLLDDVWLAPVLSLEPILPRIEGERDDDLAERRTLLRLTVELVGYFYYSRTLLELFDTGSDQAVDRLIAAVDSDDGAALGELVRARQNFAVNPFLAWAEVSGFRARPGIGLPAFELPAALTPPRLSPVPDSPADQSSYAPAG